MPAKERCPFSAVRLPAALALVLVTAGCLDGAPASACQDVTTTLAQAPGPQRLEVCGLVNGASRTGLVLTQATPPASLPLVIDPAAAEQPDIAALLRAVDQRTGQGGLGRIQARVSGVLVAGPDAAGAKALKVLAVADLQAP
jgi:hypothetical protein